MKIERIVLASKSPRRKQLLDWAGIPYEVIVSETDESFPEHLSPREAAIHIAVNKATEVKKNIGNTDANGKAHTILAADTIVVLNNKIIGKQPGIGEAIKTLSALSGKTHTVITGVCILSGEKKIAFADETQVEFNKLTKEQIKYYVENYKPFDKAGAYAIQEWIGVIGIRSISGDFYNVMGLPVNRIVKELQSLG